MTIDYRPKGGKDKRVPWKQLSIKVPESIKPQVQELAQFYYRWVAEGGNYLAPPRFVISQYEQSIAQSPSKVRGRLAEAAIKEQPLASSFIRPELVGSEPPRKPEKIKEDKSFTVGTNAAYIGQSRPDISQGEVVKVTEKIESPDGVEWLKGTKEDESETNWIRVDELKKVRRKRKTEIEEPFTNPADFGVPSLPSNVLQYLGGEVTAQVRTLSGIINGTIYQNSLVVLLLEASPYQGYVRVKPISAQWLSGIDVPLQTLAITE